MYKIIIEDLVNDTKQELVCDGFLLGISSECNEENDDVEIGTTIANLSVGEVDYMIEDIIKEVEKFNQANQWLGDEENN